ncbi:MAG: ATP-binding protein [Methanomicrobiales archaeon]|nr:ATP-binding protein [Methanomicrobiales archaeon]
MDGMWRWVEGVPYAPCPPEEFCGRHEERERILALLNRAEKHGQAVMISGPPGIGKSSLLNWLKYDLQDRPGGPGSLVIRAEIFEPPRMIFSAFRKLLYDLQLHAASGWFQDLFVSEGMKEAVRYANDLLEKYAAPVEPVGLLPKTGEEIIGVFARSPEVEYDRVREAHLELLRELGWLMAGFGRIAAILLDDAHLASRPDRRLLLDIARDLPPGILLAFTCRDESGYEEIRDRGAPLVPLSGMRGHEIQEMGLKRFDLPLDEATAALLAEARGDPFSLVACFNTLRNRGLDPSPDNIRDLLAGGGDPAEMAFAAIPEFRRAWAEAFSVLIPPFPVPVMACIPGIQGLDEASVIEQMQGSTIFRRLPGGGYAFAHSLLQEHCRQKLSADEKVSLNARAAECFERLMHRLLIRPHALLSLVCHYFNAQDYARAADLSLELGIRYHHRGDYDAALMLTGQAITSAEHLGNGALLAAAVRERDLIRQEMADPDETAR